MVGYTGLYWVILVYVSIDMGDTGLRGGLCGFVLVHTGS